MAPTDQKNSAQWPELPQDHPLVSFQKKLPGILAEAQHNEIWQINLDSGSPPPFTTVIILQKFLRANAGNVDKAAEQLLATLKWRKSFKPLDTLKEEFDAALYQGLGYISVLKDLEGKQKVVTWNIYGSVKDYKGTFGDVDRFLRWRVALMERGIELLGLKDATEPIPDYDGKSEDPYQMIQVHDYKTVSMFRMDPHVKAASRVTIQTFRDFYPELLCDKYFTNTPWIFQTIFNGFKMIIPSQTFKKFHIVANGEDLKKYISADVPGIYGGNGGTLEENAETVRFTGESSQLVVDANTAPLKSPAQESFVSAQERHENEDAFAVPNESSKKVDGGDVKSEAAPATEKTATEPEPPVAELTAVNLGSEKPVTDESKPEPTATEPTVHDPEKAAAATTPAAQPTPVQS